jgi:DNA repair exonuclease SbcCD ATPase subunit
MQENERYLRKMFAETDRLLKETRKEARKEQQEARKEARKEHKEMNNLQNIQVPTFDSVYVDLQEVKRFLAEKSAETDRLFKEAREEARKDRTEARKEREEARKARVEARKERKENDRLFKEAREEARKDRKENDRLFKEARKDRKETKQLFNELREDRRETNRQMRELQQQYGGISNSNGEMAEQFFYSAFKRSKSFVKETFDEVLRNRCISNGEWEAEFDLVLFNGKSVAIIEVKYRAKYDNISIEELIAKIEPFKVLFPKYKNHNIFLGVAAMSFDKRLAKKLRKVGIATVYQEGKKIVVYDEEVKTF